MSIRIYNEGLSGAAAPETSRAQDLARTGAGSRSSSATGSSGEDQVQISSLSESLSSQATSHAAHVENLKALYQAGRYQVNASEVSHAIVNSALSGTSGSEK